MAKSTHPFVMRMNDAKALHRAMRAGEEQDTAEPVAPKAETPPAKRTVTLKPKATEPAKGILTAVVT